MKKKLEKLRANIFWTLDSLKGGKVRKHFVEVKSVLEGKDDPKQKCDRNLRTLLDHAVRTTKFYGPPGKYESLADFPVIDKNVIRSNFEAFKSGIYDDDSLIPVVTSGSTGTPFKVLHDHNKRLRNNADTLYFAAKGGFNVGDRLIYLKIWSKNNTKSRLRFFIQNIVPVDVITFNDHQIEGLIQSIENDNSTFGFLGYASALELICKYLDRSNRSKIIANVNSVIAMSESLNEYTKTTIEKYFGVPALSRYSNLENGIIAQQCEWDSGRYLVNTGSYLVEIFDMDSDKKLPDGQLGRIVVTDLFNFGMPMIRYDTGDIGAIAKTSDGTLNTYLEHVEGRKLDLLFDINGNLVSSYIVYKNMWKYTEISQYQLIQEGKRSYTFKVNLTGNFEREPELIAEFKQYLGNDADFKVECVNEIPLLASGKRKKIVNKFYTDQILKSIR